MSPEEIVAKVKALMVEILQEDEAELGDSVTFRSLGADSLDLVNLVESLQEEFKIAIEDEEIDSATTIGDFCQLVAFKVHH